MKKVLLLLLLSGAATTACVLPSLAQDRDAIESLKKAELEKKFLQKIRKAIEGIKKDREVKVVFEWEVIDVSDIVEDFVPNYYAPNPRIRDLEAIMRGGGPSPIPFDEEDDEESWDSDGLEEWIRLKTGERAWKDFDETMLKVHGGLLFVRNTAEVIRRVKEVVEKVRRKRREIVSLHLYLLSAAEEYMKRLSGGAQKAVLNADMMKKLMDNARKGRDVKLLRAAVIMAHSGQKVCLFDGVSHSYKGDCDTSGAGGLAPMEVYDPIINIMREGLTVGVMTRYNRDTDEFELTSMVALAHLHSLQEHTVVGGMGNNLKTFKVEVPKMSLQIIRGTGRVKAGCGLLLGGSRTKTSEKKRKNPTFILLVPTLQRR